MILSLTHWFGKRGAFDFSYIAIDKDVHLIVPYSWKARRWLLTCRPRSEFPWRQGGLLVPYNDARSIVRGMEKLNMVGQEVE